MGALARGDIPAIILRQQYEQSECGRLVARFYERDLVDGLPKPGEAIPEKPEFERVDIGTSLGNLGPDRTAFFASAEATLELHTTLFEGLTDPVKLLYDNLTLVSPGKTAVTAREPNGRIYGPAIFRCHMPHFGYPPHIDSVRQREKRTDYAVHRFETQLAGILSLQPPERSEGACDSILYECAWSEELDRLLKMKWTGKKLDMSGGFNRPAFDQYVALTGIRSHRVILQPGDMYFFNTERLHEVPQFTGHRTRIVEACFFGYSKDDPEIFVWS